MMKRNFLHLCDEFVCEWVRHVNLILNELNQTKKH